MIGSSALRLYVARRWTPGGVGVGPAQARPNYAGAVRLSSAATPLALRKGCGFPTGILDNLLHPGWRAEPSGPGGGKRRARNRPERRSLSARRGGKATVSTTREC